MPLEGGGGEVDGEALHPRSKATRRGPMDEMRQLVCPGPPLPCRPLGLQLTVFLIIQ